MKVEDEESYKTIDRSPTQFNKGAATAIEKLDCRKDRTNLQGFKQIRLFLLTLQRCRSKQYFPLTLRPSSLIPLNPVQKSLKEIG